MRSQPDQIIRQLEIHNSRLDKESVLESAVEEGLTEFFLGLKMALDPLITFGVKQVPLKEEIWTEDGASKTLEPNGQGLAWSVFTDLANKLQARELTGHDARDAVLLAMNVATTQQWNDWYRRILIKDLRCGVSEKTVNKVLKKCGKTEWSVPVFTCMLAHDGANHPNKIKSVRQIEPKLDGVRTLAVIHDVHGNKIEMFSRNGKQFANFGHIVDQLSKLLKDSPAHCPIVLDGEVMSENFQQLMKQVHRKDNVNSTDAVFYVFDMIPLEDFLKGRYDKTQSFRSLAVQHWIRDHAEKLPNVKSLESQTIDLDTEEGKAQFAEINAQAIEQGYEGLVIKDPEAAYESKRSHSWLKVKPVISVDLTVTELQEGTGRNAGLLGALVCEGIDSGKQIKVNVGSGLSDSQRKEFWENQHTVIGSTVEIMADAITKSQDSDSVYSLRFPRFHRFRDDK